MVFKLVFVENAKWCVFIFITLSLLFANRVTYTAVTENLTNKYTHLLILDKNKLMLRLL